ncbi:MAG: hypothetical protein ABIH46_03525 [Chloroflexota bacterium]
MIRDAIALEQKGIPTVTIVHDKFMAAAQAQARILNLPALPLVSVPQPLPWETHDDERRKADTVIDRLVAKLSQGQPQASEG